MPFIHPAIFWLGLAAVSLPIIIHLINRKRYRRQSWAAMQFLLESLKLNRQRLRLEQWLLLALRCAIVAMLGAGLARATGCAGGGLLPGTSSQSVVFLLDDSGSMAHKVGGATVLSQAAGDVAAAIRKLPANADAAVLLSSHPEQPMLKLTRRSQLDVDALAERLGSLQASDQRLDARRCFEAASKLMDEVKGSKQICFASDFQRGDYDKSRLEEIQKQASLLAERKIHLRAVNYARQAEKNLTIESLALLDRTATAKAPLRAELVVRNNGSLTASDVRVHVTAKMLPDGGREWAEVSLPTVSFASIAPGETARTELSLVLPIAGPAAVAAELPADELPKDNKAWLAMEVKPALKVLLVDGKAGAAELTDRESFFIQTALDPRHDGRYGVAAEVVAPSQMEAIGLGEYDLVAMLNVPEFGWQMGHDGKRVWPAVETLREYVTAGGGLAVFSGDEIKGEFYNGPLYDAGLVPLKLGASKAAGQNKFFRIDGGSIQADSMLAIFQKEGAALVSAIRFFEFTATQTGETNQAAGAAAVQVLAKFNDADHSPAIAVRQLGLGSVAMFFTSASADWSDWPSEPLGTYVAAMHDLVQSVSRRQERLSGLVGQAIRYLPPSRFGGASVTLKMPSYPKTEMVNLRADGAAAGMVEFADAGEAGVYELEFAGQGTGKAVAARNIDPAEGKLAGLEREEVLSAFGGRQNVSCIARGGEMSETILTAGEGAEYWQWLVGAALVMLAAETWLARRFGHSN